MSKHHWKKIPGSQASGEWIVQVDECVLCGCHRINQYLRNGKIHFTNYSTDGVETMVRSAPVCLDKVNLELEFPESLTL